MNAVTISGSGLEVYVCPDCKRHLRQEDGALRCPSCSKAYPLRQGIPDFVLEELSRSADPELRRMRFIDQIARIYETKLAVFTFTAGRGGILRYRQVRARMRRDHGLHVFELPEIEQYLTDSGFEDFQPEVSGSILTFSAWKQQAGRFPV